MLETARLIIKPWSDSDAEGFYLLTQDEGFNLFPITRYTQKTIDTARAWIVEARKSYEENGTGMLAVWERSSGQLIGMAGLRIMGANERRYEVTYRLRESAWGKGFATEVAKAIITYGFEVLRLDEIAASITPDNEPSKRVAQKLGMKRTGTEILLGVEAEIFRVSKASW
jgi:[ribosomal protein S5]-alanine N-acetyltransferase